MRYVGDTSTLYPANDTGALAARLRGPLRVPRARRAALAQRERWAFLTRFNATEMARADRGRVRVGDQGAGRGACTPAK